MRIDVAQRARPRHGEIECGDRIVVRTDAARTLLLVIDALGHGPEAAEVADLAARVAGNASLGEGPLHVVRAMHDALRGSRGAAAMACIVEGGVIRGCGVGNVELRAHPRQVPSVLSSGILGALVRSFKVFEGSLGPRTRLLMFSDGIATTRLAAESGLAAMSAQEACDRILESCSRAHDDAAILVADLLEGP